MRNIIGLDIGTTAVRLVQVSKPDTDGFVTITGAHVEPMPDRAMATSQVNDATTVGLTVASALSNAKMRGPVVVGLTTTRTDLVTLDIPAHITGRDRDDLLRNPGRELSPRLKMANSYVSWSTIGTDPTGDGTREQVAVALAHLDDVELLTRACTVAGVTPVAIDLNGAAALRAVSRTRHGIRDTETVINLGAGSTLVATRTGPALRSLQVIPHGGARITQELMGPLRADFAAADERKRGLRISDAPDQTRQQSSLYIDNPDAGATATSGVDAALSDTANRLVYSILTAIDQDEQRHGSRTRRILLTGQGALLRGLAELVQVRTNVETRIGLPWVHPPKSRRGGFEPDQSFLLGLTTAIGLALWEKPA